MKTLDDIKHDLLHEIAEREALTRKTFGDLREKGKSDISVDAMSNALTEIRCLRRTLETLKKGG